MPEPQRSKPPEPGAQSPDFTEERGAENAPSPRGTASRTNLQRAEIDGISQQRRINTQPESPIVACASKRIDSQYEFAVCPPIKQGFENQDPKLFKTKLEAEQFLDSELPLRWPIRTPPPAPEAPKGLEPNAEHDRPHVPDEPGDLEAVLILDYQPEPMLNRTAWHGPVPIRRMSDYSDSECHRTLREYLQPDILSKRASAFKPYENTDRWFYGGPSCYLDEDWRWDEIEADACERAAHQYHGSLQDSICKVVVKAVIELEEAFRKTHPQATCKRVCDFWNSWQVRQHIAAFCASLAEPSEETETARVLMCRELSVFADDVLSGTRPEGSTDSVLFSAPDAPDLPNMPIGLITVPTAARRHLSKNPKLEKLKTEVREMHAAKLSHAEMCRRLDGRFPTPPIASWADLGWNRAFKNKRWQRAVRKWLSSAANSKS